LLHLRLSAITISASFSSRIMGFQSFNG